MYSKRKVTLNINQEMVERLIFEQQPHVAKAFSYPKHISKILNIMVNSFSCKSKFLNSNPLKQKRQNFVFLGLKTALHKKLNYIHKFILQILIAVCLPFVHILNIAPIPFQIVKQKIFQQCETMFSIQVKDFQSDSVFFCYVFFYQVMILLVV